MEKETINFLNNNDFVSWQLTGDPYLESFWEEYIESHPEQREAFEKAIRDFSRIQLNKETLSDTEQAYLLGRIHTSLKKTDSKRQLHRITRYAAAACILLIAGYSFYHYRQTEKQESNRLTENLIIGVNLDDQEIHLITDSGTSSFSHDVRVHIDKEGSAIVEEEGIGSTHIETSKSAMTKLIVPYGKRSEITLSDGTRVWVNSGSVLEFPNTFSGNTRTVNLTGEMYAEVVKDAQRPFIVSTGDFQVKVHGTKFNVSAYRDDASQSVVLIEGSVGVKNSTEEETLLQPNEMLSYKESVWSKMKVDVSDHISWKDGLLILNSTPITDVLRQIERYYNLTFNIPQSDYLEKVTCTGKIYLSEDLDNIMETITLLSSTQYKREDKIISITINHHKENMPMK